ncbi:MAG: porin family protein [Chloroflexia bacterium]|nr:porin family protein [Chloroflexia bacterium]
MKKILVLLFSAFLLSTALNAQVTPFKFELGALYGLPTDDAFVGGVGFYVHPSYYISDQFNLGIKAEWAVLGAASEEGLSVSVSAIGSYLLTANYYLSVSKVRPYIGVGVGLYQLGSVSTSIDPNNSLDIEYGDKFGVAPKIGLDLGHFTLNVAYNYIFGIESTDQVELASKNYLSLGIGAFFGGGVHGGGSKNKNKIISIDDEEDL